MRNRPFHSTKALEIGLLYHSPEKVFQFANQIGKLEESELNVKVQKCVGQILPESTPKFTLQSQLLFKFAQTPLPQLIPIIQKLPNALSESLMQYIPLYRNDIYDKIFHCTTGVVSLHTAFRSAVAEENISHLFSEESIPQHLRNHRLTIFSVYDPKIFPTFVHPPSSSDIEQFEVCFFMRRINFLLGKGIVFSI